MAGKFIFLFLLGLGTCVEKDLKLKQVWALSRHNLRTPLTSSLSTMTPNAWPDWNEEVAYLTKKGKLLENKMGRYFSAWLRSTGLLPEGCPDDGSVFIYANTRQRTKATAQAFTESAFPECNITVFYKNIEEMDPIFNPGIHNTSERFHQAISDEMRAELNSQDLYDAYLKLNKILNIANSKVCKEDNLCDLTSNKSDIVIETEEEPSVTGPFFIANSVVDSLIMSFYEGMPLQDIGWGQLNSTADWTVLTKILKANQAVRFGVKNVAKDIIKPLLQYLKQKLSSNYKFTLLVGHDSNLTPIMKVLDFEPYDLPKQWESTPVGGKIVFQKWSNEEEDYLKIEYIYQTSWQLRNADELTLSNPPKRVVMRLKDCVTDDQGFCRWSDFEKILKEATA